MLGRWHSQDPIINYASPYNGIGNNPVNLIDRWGMCPGNPPEGGGGTTTYGGYSFGWSGGYDTYDVVTNSFGSYDGFAFQYTSVKDMISAVAARGGGATFNNGVITSTYSPSVNSLIYAGGVDIVSVNYLNPITNEEGAVTGVAQSPDNTQTNFARVSYLVGDKYCISYLNTDRGSSIESKKAWYGNFVGPEPDGPGANPFALPDPKNPGHFLQPIDAIDKAAQNHDYAYWKAGASGVKGALFDKRVAPADAILVAEAFNIIKSYQNGGIDNVTLEPISIRTYGVAVAVFYTFAPITINKIDPLK